MSCMIMASSETVGGGLTRATMGAGMPIAGEILEYAPPGVPLVARKLPTGADGCPAIL
jgi:hypothetical protein